MKSQRFRLWKSFRNRNYRRVTRRTLEALREASLREREALHLREIKGSVVQPILSWIQRLSNMLREGMPDLLTVSSFDHVRNRRPGDGTLARDHRGAELGDRAE